MQEPNESIEERKMKPLIRYPGTWLVVASLALLAGLSGYANAAPNLPPPLVQLPSHLGVKGADIVQITTTRTAGGGPPSYSGWQVLRGNGTLTDYLDSENPLTVPAGKVLIITDLYLDFNSTGDGGVELLISQGTDESLTRVFAFQANDSVQPSAFASTFREHMTTGFMVPPGWQLELPKVFQINFAIIVRMQGYFATLE